MNPLLEALKVLGGSRSVQEIASNVAEVAHLTDEQLQVPHGNGRGYWEVEYAWLGRGTTSRCTA